MTPASTHTIPSLEDELTTDEGFQRFPYKDTKGFWTIAVGFNLEAHGYTQAQIDNLKKVGITRAWAEDKLAQTISEVRAGLDKSIPWWLELDAIRRRVLINMTFNMGLGKTGGEHGLLSWGHTLSLIKAGRYVEAAHNMRHSEWYQEVGDRAERLSRRMETGVY